MTQEELKSMLMRKSFNELFDWCWNTHQKKCDYQEKYHTVKKYENYKEKNKELKEENNELKAKLEKISKALSV